MNKGKDGGGNTLWRYAGMGAQFAVATGLGIFLGLKIDDKLRFSTPWFVWILPLVLIIGMLIKIVIETNKKS